MAMTDSELKSKCFSILAEQGGSVEMERFIMLLNRYPIIAPNAHTRPFRRKWLNIITGLFLPTGVFFYFRMIRFRFRLFKDLQHIQRTNGKLISRIEELYINK